MRRIFPVNLLRSIPMALAAISIWLGSAVAEEVAVSAANWYQGYLQHSRLVALKDGRALNLYCMGAGSPTVILESGITESAFSWWTVQPRISGLTRVCAYDRAGLGRSPAGPMPRDTRAQVDDLEALLSAAEVKPPYILVGHSMGGYNMRVFASRHRSDVAGILLVDPSVENQVPIFEAAAPAIAENDQRQTRRTRACADPNRSAEIAKLCTRPAPPDFPPGLAQTYGSSFDLRYFQSVQAETDAFIAQDSQEVVDEQRPLGSIPLIVLTRGARSSDLPSDQAETEWRIWNQMHDQLAQLSSQGSNRVIAGASHYIQIDKPDVVVGAITELVRKARSAPGRAYAP